MLFLHYALKFECHQNTHKLPSPFIVKLEKSYTKYGSIVLRPSGIGGGGRFGWGKTRVRLTSPIGSTSSAHWPWTRVGWWVKADAHTHRRTDEGITEKQQTDTLYVYINYREVHSLLPIFRHGNLERCNICF